MCAHHEQAGIILLLALPLPYVPPALVIAATLLCDVLPLAISVALTFPVVPATPSTRPRKRGASRHRPEYHGSGGAALATDVCSTFRSTFVMRSLASVHHYRLTRALFGQGRGSALCIFALVLSSPSPIYLRTLLLGSFMAFPMELDLLPSVPRVWWPSMLALLTATVPHPSARTM